MILLELLVLLPTIGLAVTKGNKPPDPLPPLPSERQLKWQDRELTIFVHFGVNTFTNREWGEGTEKESIFNPVKLDARQWARSAKAGGFKMMILTAKHHDGFCLWPSKFTEHSVKNSPFRGGKGDVVREFVDAVRAEGLEVGLYLSPWDRHEPTYGDSPKYNAHYMAQLRELLTTYGPIKEVWFDGACGEGPNGKKQEYDWKGFIDTVRKYAPDACVFSDAGPDVRWIGNESGFAGETCWSTVEAKRVIAPGLVGAGGMESLNQGNEGGNVFRPGECDVSIRPGWFWHKIEDDKVHSLDNLTELYFQSVGRNSLLLLNVPPNTDGLWASSDVQRLAEFKERLDAMFKTDLCKNKPCAASNVRGVPLKPPSKGPGAYPTTRFSPSYAVDGNKKTYWATDDGVTSAWLEVDLLKPTQFNISCVQEYIELGQRVKAYHIEVWDGSAWQTAVKGTTVGRKKLDRFPAVTAQRVRLVIDDARACPTIRTFSLYHFEP